jgi:hypothetical protein
MASGSNAPGIADTRILTAIPFFLPPAHCSKARLLKGGAHEERDFFLEARRTVGERPQTDKHPADCASFQEKGPQGVVLRGGSGATALGSFGLRVRGDARTAIR